MLVSTIIVAAGSGKRMGTSVPKQFLDINGIPILSLSLLYFEKTEIVNEVIIVALPEWIDYVKKRIVLKGRFKKVSRVIEGGKLRQHSFQNGLAVAKGEIIIDHDSARPFPGMLDVDGMVKECTKVGAIIPVILVNDTVKYVKSEKIEKTIDRSNLFYVQTPQVFKKELCEKAYKRAEEDRFYGSDTASLLENAGIPVFTTSGSIFNIKITTKDDLVLAGLINQYYFNRR